MERKAFGKHLVMFWLTALLLCFAGVCTAAADDTYTVNVTGTYGQTEARSMLEMINEFRTGDDAWYWNSDDTTKTTCSDLGELTYDYGLEQVAMKRAMETAIYWSHTRPNGTSCFTLSVDSVRSYGENIAYGTRLDAEGAFTSWKEEDEDYSGQGHRRNMLGSSYTAIGIGYVYYNGMHFWVQEFGYSVSSASATEANDSTTTESIEIAASEITTKQMTFSPESLVFQVESETALPTVSIKIKTEESRPSSYYCPITVDGISWTSADSSTASISGENVIGEAVGTTSISTTILGEEQTVSVTVEKIDLTEATVAVSDSCTYTGSALTPTPTVTLDGSVLPASCYTVSYSDNTNAGTATVTITGTGNYEGTASGTFTIAAASVESCSAAELSAQTYTGSALEPALTVTYGSMTLTAGTDYTVVYSNNTNVGTATAALTGTGNYTGTKEISFTIQPFDISGCTVDSIAEQTYTGSALEPALTVTYGSEMLAAGTDYTVVYSNNTDVGTATATLTGSGNYTGTAEASFTIGQCDVSGCTVDSIADQTYTGEALEPAVTVKNGSVTLTKDTDYTLSYSSNVNAGTATVTIEGTGNYTGTKEVSFTINPFNISGCTVDSITAQTYTGDVLEPTVTVKNGTAALEKGTDYTLSYADNTNAGTATVTITGTGNYTGTVSGTFTIAAAPVEFCIAAEISAQAYTGAALEPALTVTYGSMTLTAGTDYTVVYSNNTNVGTATATMTGTGNYTGTKEVSFTIQPFDISGCTVDSIAEQTYTGSALEPTLTVTYGSETLAAGTDYTVVYSNNTDAGTATATLTGNGNYTGTKEVSFTVSPFDISGCTVDAIADQTFTGEALTPAVTVTNGSVTLTAGTDYTFSYSSNVNAGTAAVTIEGTGNYTGSLTGSFTIGQAEIANCTVADLSAQYYTGEAIMPEVYITLGDYALVKDTDYTLSYANNTEVGTAAVTIQGTGNFEGSAEVNFTIQPAPTETTEATTTTTTEAGTEPGTTQDAEGTTESTTTQDAEATTESSTTPTTEASTEPTTTSAADTAAEPTVTPTPEPAAAETPSGENDSDEDTDADEIDAERVVPEGGATLTDKATGAVYRVTQASADEDPVAVYQKPQNAKTASVVVPDTITVNERTCRVTAIANNAFKNNRALKKVKIGKYVQTIGKNAFYGCTKLTSVTGGAFLTKIGDSAFQKCTALKKITIPAKVKSIGKKAFYGCKKLRSVTIKTKLLTAKSVGSKAFSGTYKKATVKVPSSRLKLYKKVLRAKGLSKSAKIKK